MRRRVFFILIVSGLAALSVLVWWNSKVRSLPSTELNRLFDGDRAYQDVLHQDSLGPRTYGSEAHAEFVRWALGEFDNTGWQSKTQVLVVQDKQITNIVAYRSTAAPVVVLAAHYDSRIWADKDEIPELRKNPVPGANDGASGVAVLLELARTLPDDIVPTWIVLFDAEDNGDIPGWDWIMGSQAFVESFEHRPQAVVIVDMVGDKELNLHLEVNSNLQLATDIWAQAAALGYGDVFIPTPKYAILDDHIPFLEAGIPAVDIIDIDYPYWHTTQDTPDKVSAGSLHAVGDTLWHWLVQFKSGE